MNGHCISKIEGISEPAYFNSLTLHLSNCQSRKNKKSPKVVM